MPCRCGPSARRPFAIPPERASRQSAAAFPDRPALEVGGRTLRYTELRDYAASLAASLIREAPGGEPALTAPDSVSWQVFKNPLALFVCGVTAVILELAEPRVRTGVWRLHERIGGTTPDGQRFRADEPKLLDWVHATASFGFLKAHHAYVRGVDDAARRRLGRLRAELGGSLAELIAAT